MNVETIREYCLSKKGVTESFPFDNVSLVMKVMDKMFALIDLEGANSCLLYTSHDWHGVQSPYDAASPESSHHQTGSYTIGSLLRLRQTALR